MDTKGLFKLNKNLKIHNLINLDTIIDMYVDKFEFIDIGEFTQLSRILPPNYYSVYINETAMYLNTDIGVRDNRGTIMNQKRLIKNKDFYNRPIQTSLTIPNIILKTLGNNTIKLVNHIDIITIYHSVNAIKLRYTRSGPNKKHMNEEIMEMITTFLETILTNNAGYLSKYLEELKIIEEENIKVEHKEMKKSTLGDIFPDELDRLNVVKEKVRVLNSLPTRTYQDSIIEATRGDEYYDNPNHTDASIDRVKKELDELQRMQKEIDATTTNLVNYKLNKTSRYRLGVDGNLYPIYNIKQGESQ